MIFLGCKFCGHKDVLPFPIATKRRTAVYFRCKNCGAISLSDKEYLSKAEQLSRYRQHNNDLVDLGYAKFLGDFLLSVFSFLPSFSPAGILDYGSGPNPALVQLMRLVSKKQGEAGGSMGAAYDRIDSLDSYAGYLARTLPPLPGDHGIYGWDPFFAPHKGEEKAPLVLCLEVAEHFENPAEGFAGLAGRCLPGGFVAVGTLPIPDTMATAEDFKKWWYKDDRTHVSFYTEKAMAACGKSCGLEYRGKASPRVFVFKKPGDAQSSVSAPSVATGIQEGLPTEGPAESPGRPSPDGKGCFFPGGKAGLWSCLFPPE